MIDLERFAEILALYKVDFASTTWQNEKYKWEAVKHFQDNWDINAPDFAKMLEASLAKTSNLLTSVNNYPKGMIIGFAKAAPEDVRAMFMALFDESRDYWERINGFKEQSKRLHDTFKQGNQDYQNENAITTYLWLRYPDRYYVYKYGQARAVAQELGSKYIIKQGHYADNVRNHLALYDEINAELKRDGELRKILDKNLTAECYPDPEMRTLTTDFCYYISSYLHNHDDDNAWWPERSEYDPGLTVDDWAALLVDPEVFTDSSLQIMRRLLDYGGAATCTQLAEEYGETKNFYNSGSSALAKRVAKKTSCPVMSRGDGSGSKWWPVLYVGRPAGEDDKGSWVWRLRDELAEALDHIDLSENTVKRKRKGRPYPKNATVVNVHCPKMLVAKLKLAAAEEGKTMHDYILDLLMWDQEQDGKEVRAKLEGAPSSVERGKSPENTEDLSIPIDCEALDPGPGLVREQNPLASEKQADGYDKADFLRDVYMDDARYEQLRAILMHKKNVILQGAPGVGKTFCARRLAWSIMGEKDDNRIEFVQFHQSYSYEDFIMGYRPEGDSFELKYGIFFRFCQKAANQPDKPFFFIIDEINRGNMSKIFGELLMLIEADYRGTKVTLAYNGMPFSVPENLYIIGMMNTADRSLAMIDYALRRRFSFFDMEPGFDTKGFSEYRESLGSETIDELVDRVKDLNAEIARDKSLGKGFCIGHSYFCGRKPTDDADSWGRQVVDFDIMPMLREYWFDDEAKVTRWDNVLHGVFQR